MKLYNIYQLCKKNIYFYNILNTNRHDKLYTIENWTILKDTLHKLEKIPVLQPYVNSYINVIPDENQDEDVFLLDESTYSELGRNKNLLLRRMETIVELYESLNIKNEANGIDIKLPPCDDLKDYISYLKEIDFIFSQCPFLQYQDELLKFNSVDVGSNWIKLTVAATSTCLILTTTASLIDKALLLRSHYISLQQQEEMLKSQQIKNELAEENIKTFDALRTAYMNIIIKQLQSETGKSLDPEELDKAERSLDKIVLLLDKGCEIYATLDSPDEVQALFPEIQGDLELPDSVIKYLEDKEKKQD